MKFRKGDRVVSINIWAGSKAWVREIDNHPMVAPGGRLVRVWLTVQWDDTGAVTTMPANDFNLYCRSADA